MVSGRLNRESNPVPGEKPGFLPQHESETSGEFVVTGERNPYPVKIKNTDEQAIPVKLTGSNVELLGVIKPGIITAGAFVITSTTFDVSKYARVTVARLGGSTNINYTVDVRWDIAGADQYAVFSDVLFTDVSYNGGTIQTKAKRMRVAVTNKGASDGDVGSIYVWGLVM